MEARRRLTRFRTWLDKTLSKFAESNPGADLLERLSNAFDCDPVWHLLRAQPTVAWQERGLALIVQLAAEREGQVTAYTV